MKTVNKPWGKEVWLELNDRYCYKRIYINAGHRTSLQYHNYKIETNYIISGTAEVWLENDDGEIVKTIMKEGDFFNVKPPKIHRVIAITDIILQEVSTPEVDDVIRIQDDASRPDGRIENEHLVPAACILTAGTGSRLGHMVDKLNKSLLPVGDKAVISNIIDNVPEEYDIIVCLGHEKEVVKDYCLSVHGDRNIQFVEVDKYVGDGTGPGYSLSFCKDFLQRPFYIATCDTVLSEKLLPITENWLGLSPTGIPELYSTADLNADGKVVSFKNKSKSGYKYAFIGVCAIKQYDTFWEQLEKTNNNGELVDAFVDVDAYSDGIYGKSIDWLDIGTIDNYLKCVGSNTLPKNNEFMYQAEGKCIKIFGDEKITSQRIERAKRLSGFVPEIIDKKSKLYSYEWIKGDTLYDIDDFDLYCKFLDWASENIWNFEEADLSSEAMSFYKDKTLKRLRMFLNGRDHSYTEEHWVNNNHTVPIMDLIEKIDWDSLISGVKPNKLFHGDLQFDNIIFSENDGFTLIDWRQSFTDNIEMGDGYYDFGKLYGGLSCPYNQMKRNNFEFRKQGNNISFDIECSDDLKRFEEYYENWLDSHGFDLQKVKLITALIYLNMSPLHVGSFGDLIFFKGKLLLQELIND